MFFSIILPIYNVEKYLCECIDSILKQNFSDYEIILVDDGSTDSSPQICDEYEKKDSRVKVIHKKNGGLSDARNHGTDIAQGNYIIYIDSDDYVITKTFLMDIYKKIELEKSDIILYKFSKYYDHNNLLEGCNFSLCTNDTHNPAELLYELVKKDAYYGMAWIKAFSKEIIIKNEIKFEKNLLGEDMDWYFNLLLHTKTISVIDKSYIAYRQREGSITKSLKIKNLTDYIYILEKWSDIIYKLNPDETKTKALKGALAKYYANLLVVYSRLKDKNKKLYKQKVKKLSFLLKDSLSQRPLKIRKVYKILGFNITIFMLKIYDKLRNNI